MVAEYLEKAISFEQLAAGETDEKLRVGLLSQVRTYRKLAADRALQDLLIQQNQRKNKTARRLDGKTVVLIAVLGVGVVFGLLLALACQMK